MVSYVGTRVDPFTVTTSGTAYQLRCPTGLLDGDVLIGFIAWEGSNTAVCTPMNGWTMIATVGVNDGSDDWTFFIQAKDAVLADSGKDYTTASDLGAVDFASTRRSCVVHAYRNAAAITSQTWSAVDSNINTAATGGLTDTINNPDANNWVIGFVGIHATTAQTFTASAGYTTQRHILSNGSADPIMSHAVHDSNGAVTTGNKNITFTPSGTEDNMLTWIGIIQNFPPPAAPPAGSGLFVSNQARRRAHYW